MSEFHRINIKPLTVNRAYQGRRFRTPELLAYQQELAYRLPKIEVPKGKLDVSYVFGVSSRNSDLDNCVKAFQDALAEQYGFNDRDVYRMEVEKQIVPKGKEFVGFDLQAHRPLRREAESGR
jgi:Holliday junction resolvase RusA-like endonuclease